MTPRKPAAGDYEEVAAELGLDLSEFTDISELEELRAAYGRLQKHLLRAKDRDLKLAQAVYDGARDALLALGPLPAVVAPKRDRRAKPVRVALWHLTDWQGAKKTTSYNSDVMRERVARFCDEADQITLKERSNHVLKHCVIMYGGDMGEGLFNFPTQPYEIDATLVGQFMQVAKLCAEVVRRALVTFETVEVISEFGNHGRLGDKRAAVPASDNLDRMIYELARAYLGMHLGLQPHLTWEDSEEDMRRVVIGNYHALLLHGDEVGRNGHASPNTIVQHVTKWQAGGYTFEGEPWPFVDAYAGHYHTHQEYPLPNGRGAVFFSGSPESDNRYAGTTMASQGSPSQRYLVIDPVKGRVAVPYRVWLED